MSCLDEVKLMGYATLTEVMPTGKNLPKHFLGGECNFRLDEKAEYSKQKIFLNEINILQLSERSR